MYVYRSLHKTGHFVFFQARSWTGANTASSFLFFYLQAGGWDRNGHCINFLLLLSFTFFSRLFCFLSGERLDRHGHCIIVIAEGAGVSFTCVSALHLSALYVSAGIHPLSLSLSLSLSHSLTHSHTHTHTHTHTLFVVYVYAEHFAQENLNPKP
jgi:hypothetical protein